MSNQSYTGDEPLLNEKAVNETRSTAIKLLKILVGLAALYTLYFAQSLILPLVFAMLIALLLGPLVKRLKRIHAPRSFSAIVLLAMLVTPFTILTVELADPVQKWVKLIPKLSSHITQELSEFSDIMQAEENPTATENAETKGGFFSNWFAQEVKKPIEKEESVVEKQIKQGGLDALVSMLTATPLFLAQLFSSLILILFLLIFGPPLFSVFVNEFPVVDNTHRAAALVKGIQQALSRYIITVSLINFGLGVATALALTFFGVDDALLWGALVALMNFVPYVGSAFSLCILLFVGGVQFGMTPFALLPSAVFFLLNMLESQVITPSILGKSMRVNPLVIIVWLILAGWLWGIIGILLAVPILVCIKLTLVQLETLPHWLKLIEANEADLSKT